MSVLDGDFIGFSFDGIHSSDLGILRVSDGSRYNEYLLPTSQDITVQVPGGDGTYYFGSYYTNRPFSISIAFDSLTEEQIRKLRQTFTLKRIGRLIFDEAPYKYYMAKVVSQPQLKYICFHKLYYLSYFLPLKYMFLYGIQDKALLPNEARAYL